MKSLAELKDELGRKLGLTIHYVVKVDFIGFVKAVDALGGVDIDVPENLVDTEYPGPDYTYETFQLLAGPQHLDGETALKYARSRHSTSDFDRSSRQQQLLHALGDKARTEGIVTSPGKLMALWKIMEEHLETDMSVGEMLGGAKLADAIDKQNLIAMNLNNAIGGPLLTPWPGGFLYNPPRAAFGGASVLLPYSTISPEGSWRPLRAFLHVLMQSRREFLARPSIHILNAGAPAGTARTLGNELTRYGFPVSEIDNFGANARDEAGKRDTSSVVATVELDAPLAEFFGDLLHVSPTPLTPDLPQEKLGQLTIILGKDYQFQPLETTVPSDADLTPLSSPSGSGSTSSSIFSSSSFPASTSNTSPTSSTSSTSAP